MRNFVSLKRATLTESWRRTLTAHTYVAFIQLVGNANWGRGAIPQRIVPDDKARAETVGVRFLPAWAGRRAAETIPSLSRPFDALMRGASFAAVYSNDPDAFQAAVRRAAEVVPSALLVAGKVGEVLLRPAEIVALVEGKSIREMQVETVSMIGMPLRLISDTLDQSQRGISAALEDPAGQLVGVLQRHHAAGEGAAGAAAE